MENTLFGIARVVNWARTLPPEERHPATEHLARTILEWFEIPLRREVPIRGFLNHFAPRPDLDRDGLIAYQAWAGYFATSDQIIWVSAEDGLIRRTATGSAVSDWRVVDSVRTNAVLARSELAGDVPLGVRVEYFTRSKPAYAAALVSFGVFLLGMVFWRIRWILVRDRDDRDDEDHRDIRNATLRRYGVFAGSLTLVLIAIVALSSLAEGGHPPLGALVLVYAIPIVVVLWLVMCFLVARHLVEIPRKAHIPDRASR